MSTDSLRKDFIEFALAREVLRFGEFTLKSGRRSPYFFNAGLFNTGGALARLGEFYARAILASGAEFDVLFGPAYKGIPLVAAVAIAFHGLGGRDVPYAFNRKEVKDHGEGGNTVGAPLRGRVLVVDDVISAGTSVRESAMIIASAGAALCGVAVALDRQERGSGELSAVQQVEAEHGVPVVSVIRLEDLVAYLHGKQEHAAHLAAIGDYRGRYGVTETQS